MNINNSNDDHDARTAVIAVSDMHINSTVALLKPTVNLDDGGTYHASRTQRAMWESWLDFWDEAGKLPAKRKIGVFNGDIGELDTKRRSSQLVTLNKATIQSMVLDVLEPALDVLDAVYVIRGTMAHTGKNGWLEEAIANDITINMPGKTTASWWHLRAKADGVRFDVSHHANMGGLPWTEKNAGNKIASIIVWRYLVNMKQPAPQVTLRSHNHRYADSGGNFETFAVCLPSWSILTEFAYRTGKENDVSSIGGVWFICENSKYQYDMRIYKPQKSRRIWALKM